MAKSITEATTKIFEQLEALHQEDRARAVNAALTLLGEPMIGTAKAIKKSEEEDDETGDLEGISAKGKSWIRKNKIESDELNEMFHVDGGSVELIGSAIGKSKREQTINTYLLTGVASFLTTGNADFSDEVARKNCQTLGCYDSANHAGFMKGFKNKITGSKGAGWKLTMPGLAAAASLIHGPDSVG